VGAFLVNLKGKFTLRLSNETSENCWTGFSWCLTTSYQISSESIERKRKKCSAYMEIS